MRNDDRPYRSRIDNLSEMSRVLIINGSLGGRQGNTAELLAIASDALEPKAQVSHLELVREPSMDRILEEVQKADGFLFGTGTYWDSWGSPMQRFLEMTAHTEGSVLWFGKPAGVIVTAHAVGAKSVVSRLFGVLNMYGMLIPPMSGMAYTFVNEVALQTASDHLRDELWKAEDALVVVHNLLQAVEGGRDWRSWSTCEGQSGEKWLFAYSGREPSPS
ncbi:MAG: NAD(P)H-dependent oxidoreductase [Armatimonadetes bacterium]|nr:NAD(P)H-dependent oxidoreductase [Armatimonadota bacterium]